MTSQGDPDAELLAGYARGEAAAARELSARLSPLVYRLALRLLQDSAAAEDVTQEAMLRLWRVAPEWRMGEARVSTWLYAVALNLCRDRLRQGRRREASPLDETGEPADPAPGIAERMQAQSRSEALHAALSTLPERQREAVTLRHIEELSNPEIAAIMGLTVEAVESLVARGKRGLANALSGRREELGYEDV
jgi:RNA polymerase sigma-70 factor (ECF subfamily)